MKKYLLIACILFVSCTKLFVYLLRPDDIERIPINLKEPNATTAHIDFRTEQKRIAVNGKLGPYTAALSSPSLTMGNTWEVITERYYRIHTKHTGLIEMILHSRDSTRTIEMSGFQGSAGWDKTLPIGVFWLPVTKQRESILVEIKVVKVDSLLAAMLKDPVIWIYRGGDK